MQQQWSIFHEREKDALEARGPVYRNPAIRLRIYWVPTVGFDEERSAIPAVDQLRHFDRHGVAMARVHAHDVRQEIPEGVLSHIGDVGLDHPPLHDDIRSNRGDRAAAYRS